MANISKYLEFMMEFKTLCEKYCVNGYFNVSQDDKGCGFDHVICKADGATEDDIKVRTFKALIPQMLNRHDCQAYAELELHHLIQHEAENHRRFLAEMDEHFKE